MAGERTDQQQQEGYVGLYRTAKPPSCSISFSDLRRLYTELNKKTLESLEKYLNTLRPQPGQDAEQLEAIKNEARRVGQLSIIIIGGRGEQIVTTSLDALNEENLPDTINTITFDSAAALQIYKIVLTNRFRLVLDFTEPPSFFAYNPWEQPTPNNSLIEVTGSDTTWVTAVYENIFSFFRPRKKKRGWLHSQATFNILNWLFGFPGALWVTYRLNNLFSTSLQDLHVTLRGALYIYLVLLGLLVFRTVIMGFRWIFPVIELEGARSKTVRRIFGAILSSLVLALLYDILRAILL